MTLRVAIVGLGNAGYTLHLPALRGLPEGTAVAGVDPSAERRDRAAKAFGIAVFADFDEMLAQAKPDVVVVGTPPDSHADYCVRSFAAGAHVLCEKPFVASVEEADRVIDAARRAGRGLAVNHEFREMPIFRAILEQARGASNAIGFAQAWQLMDMPPWREQGWRGQMRQRSLYEAGVHIIDFLMTLFGETPVAVSCSVSSGGHESDADAVALATLEFSRGRLAQIVQNRLCKGEPQYIEVRAELPDRSLRASFGGRARITAGLYRGTRPHARFDFGVSGMAWAEVGTKRTPLARNPKEPNMVATRRVFEESLRAFASGTKPPTSGDEARTIHQVIAACYHSADTGCRVTVGGADLAGLRLGVATTSAGRSQ